MSRPIRSPLNSKAALAALVVSLFAPALSWASCGDYVMVAGVQDHARRSVARQEISISPAHRHHPASPPHRTPCSGPFCSQGRPLPPLVPPAPPTLEVQEWGCPAALVAAAGPMNDEVLLAPPISHPVQASARIYHPPR